MWGGEACEKRRMLGRDWNGLRGGGVGGRDGNLLLVGGERVVGSFLFCGGVCVSIHQYPRKIDDG